LLNSRPRFTEARLKRVSHATIIQIAFAVGSSFDRIGVVSGGFQSDFYTAIARADFSVAPTFARTDITRADFSGTGDFAHGVVEGEAEHLRLGSHCERT